MQIIQDKKKQILVFLRICDFFREFSETIQFDERINVDHDINDFRASKVDIYVW